MFTSFSFLTEIKQTLNCYESYNKQSSMTTDITTVGRLTWWRFDLAAASANPAANIECKQPQGKK